jgi:uncharacterized protein
MTLRRPQGGPVAIALAIVLFLAATTPVNADEEDYPTLKYWVTDDANALLTDEELDIEALCVEVFEKRGAEIAVLTVNTTAPDEISMFAFRTFEKNALGQEGKDDGVLVMVATDDRSWRVEVGYGLEGVLPDILVNQIAEKYLVPDLQRGDFYTGLLYTVAFLGREILDNYDAGKPPKDDGDPYPISWLPLTWGQLVLVVVVFLAIALITGGRGLWLGGLFYGSGGRRWGGGRSGGGGARGRW